MGSGPRPHQPQGHNPRTTKAGVERRRLCLCADAPPLLPCSCSLAPLTGWLVYRHRQTAADKSFECFMLSGREVVGPKLVLRDVRVSGAHWTAMLENGDTMLASATLLCMSGRSGERLKRP